MKKAAKKAQEPTALGHGSSAVAGDGIFRRGSDLCRYA